MAIRVLEFLKYIFIFFFCSRTVFSPRYSRRGRYALLPAVNNVLYAAPCPLLAIPRITRVSRISIPFGLAAGTRDVSERVKNELYETCGDFY